MSYDPVVSVFCIVYNHEKYIRQCLDSLLNQITDFEYEVLLTDDASTDDTRRIVQEYLKNYPDRLKVFFQDENQCSKGIDVLSLLLPYARGKYVAFCEGDDFWTDQDKLQRQYDALESNPNCAMCVHRVQSITENGQKMDHTSPNGVFPEGVKSSGEMIKKMTFSYSFQTTSYFVKKKYFDVLKDTCPDFYCSAAISDIPFFLFFAQLGDVYYIDKVMSVWRRNSVGSWSNRVVGEKRIQHYQGLISLYQKFDSFTDGKYTASLKRAILHNEYLIYSMKRDYKSMLKSSYREFFRAESRNTKIYVYLAAHFPWVEAAYKLYKRSKE